MIPKTITSLLIKKVLKSCDSELIARLYKEDKVEELLSKNSGLESKQKEIQFELTMLKKCQEILDSFERCSVRS